MKRIMVIEDDDIMRDMLFQMLTLAGYTVELARNGLEAINALKVCDYDLVVTDMVMPVMDGIETIFELCKSHKDVKIIAISGGDRSFDSTTYLDIVKGHGADKTFVKPFGQKEFLQAVKELLMIDYEK